MEFSGLEAQVFIGVAVILGCAFVALLCDYLKGVNERLRERTLELTVRVEESDRWGQILQAQVQSQSVPVADATHAEASSPDPLLMNEITRLHRELEQMARSVASLAELKVATAGSFEPTREILREPVRESKQETPEEIKHELQEVAVAAEPAVAMASTAAMRDEARTDFLSAQPSLQAYLSSPDRSIHARKSAADSAPVAPPLFEIGSALKLPARTAEPEVIAPAPMNFAPATTAQPPVAPFIERVSIPSGPEVEVYHEPAPVDLAVERDSPEPARPGAMKIRVMRSEIPTLPAQPAPQSALPAEAVVPAVPEVPAANEPPPFEQPEPAELAMPEVAPELDPLPPFQASGDLALPSGMHDRATLDFLRNDPSPFTGLVVAIGINDYDRLQSTTGAEAAQDLVRSISQLVKSLTSNLVGPQHFASRSADDEFIIAFNGEIGPAAQRRMSSVSERLWDFQLRSIGTFSVVFSWGATEANEESFDEAVEAACERMRETRQSRKAMGGEKPRKRVVA